MNISSVISLARIDKPTGTFLLFWPCAFGVSIASSVSNSISSAPYSIDFILILKFLLGAFFARSAGCIINDMVDRDLDAQVERTKSRPLASGAITMLEAFLILVIFSLCALGILLTLKPQTIIFCLFSPPAVALYPLLKRVTYLPQLFLSMLFNFGVLVAGIEIDGFISAKILVLYIGCIFWTIAYDTIYGYMDIKDDREAGVKSLSILLEQYGIKLKSSLAPKIFLTLCYIAFIFCFYVSLRMSYNQLNFVQNASFMLIVLWLIFEIRDLNLRSPNSCMKHFKRNSFLGLALFITTLTPSII